MLFDLHLHSCYSIDALSKPETIARIASKKGIGIALTDHNNTDGWKRMSEASKKEKILFIKGEEIKVSKDGLMCGEIIAYFLQKAIAPMQDFLDVFDEIKEQGALLSCPHPFDWPRSNFRDFPLYWKNFNCMETYNARAYSNSFNKKSVDFAEGKNISCLGVSDAHTPEEIGNGLTEIDASSLEEARKALLKFKSKPVINGKAKIWHHFQTQLAKNNLAKER